LRRHRSSHDAVEVDRRVARVRVVDPYHPLFGYDFAVSDRQSGRGPDLIVVRLPDGRERSVRLSATDLAFSAEGSVPTPQTHISVRTLLPLANHIRTVLASRHEDVPSESQLDGTPGSESEHGGLFPHLNRIAAPVAPASGGDTAATGTADSPTHSACAADTISGNGDTSC
jgi:hypothetical protein